MNKNTKRFLSLALASTIVAGVPATVAHAEDTSVEALEEAATNTENYIVKDGATICPNCGAELTYENFYFQTYDKRLFICHQCLPRFLLCFDYD